MKVLNKSFVIIGAIIGAGFASGKEIYEYFAKYGSTSLLYVIPLFFLFYISIKLYLHFGSKAKGFNLQKDNNMLAKSVYVFKRKINYLNVFMFLTFLILSSAMYSSIISLFNTYLPNISSVIIYICVFVGTFFILNKSLRFLSKLTYILVPIIIICLVLISLSSLKTFDIATSFGYKNILPLPILILLYASQNTFLSSFVIIKSGENTSKKEQNLISFVVSIILCTLIVLGILCFLSCPNICISDMPLAELSLHLSPIFSLIFGIIIFMSIITTYFATLSSLREYFNGEKKYNKPIHMLGLIALCSLFNFGIIVEYLYPIIGIFGVFYVYKVYKVNNNSQFLENYKNKHYSILKLIKSTKNSNKT